MRFWPAALAVAALAAAQEMPVIRVPVRPGMVPALVVAGDGRLVNGLHATDFRLLDNGSETTLAALRDTAEQENVTVFALALPELGKAFVSDSVTLEGLPRERGGFRAGVDLKNLMKVLDHAAAAQQNGDPFSVLTAAT